MEDVIHRLSLALPGLEVRPLRQLAQAEGRLLERIRGLLFGTVLLILALAVLWVFWRPWPGWRWNGGVTSD